MNHVDNTFLPKSKKSERLTRLSRNAVGTVPSKTKSDDTEHQHTADLT